jgi:hypothetical protein
MKSKKLIVSAFLAVSCLMPFAAAAQETSNAPLSAKNKSDMVFLAGSKFKKAYCSNGLLGRALMLEGEEMLRISESDLDQDETYQAMNLPWISSKRDFLELLAENSRIALTQAIADVRNPDNEGAIAFNDIIQIQKFIRDIGRATGQSSEQIMADMMIWPEEIGKEASVRHARIGAGMVVKSIQDGELEGTEALIALRSYADYADLDFKKGADIPTIIAAVKAKKVTRKTASSDNGFNLW